MAEYNIRACFSSKRFCDSAVQRYCRPMIHKPPTLDRDHNSDLNIKALKRRRFINQWSTLRAKGLGSRVGRSGYRVCVFLLEQNLTSGIQTPIRNMR